MERRGAEYTKHGRAQKISKCPVFCRSTVMMNQFLYCVSWTLSPSGLATAYASGHYTSSITAFRPIKAV